MIKRNRKLFWNSLIMLLLLFTLFTNPALAGNVPRISVQEAHARITSGKALLVCSYSDQICRDYMLKGAILRSELDSRLSSLPKSTEIIFYCD